MSLPKTLKYFSSIRIPEAKIGKWEVVHKIQPEGKELDVLTMRDALFGFGGQPKKFRCETDYIIHELLEDGNRWMSDCPQEIYTQYELFKRFKGDVLVGGLGLGYAPQAIAELPDVTSVTVVEIQPEVVKLVWNHLQSNKITLIKGDLFVWLDRCKTQRKKYDYAFYDIWCPTGQTVFHTHVQPLREASHGIIEQKNIENFGEPTMLGQVNHALMQIIALWDEPTMKISARDTPEDIFKKSYRAMPLEWAFVNWMRQTKQTTKKKADKAFVDGERERYVCLLRDPNRWRKEWGNWQYI